MIVDILLFYEGNKMADTQEKSICFVAHQFLMEPVCSIDGVQVKMYNLAIYLHRLGWTVKYIACTKNKKKIGTCEIFDSITVYWLPFYHIFAVRNVFRVMQAMKKANCSVYYVRSRVELAGIVSTFCNVFKKCYVWASAGEGACSRHKYKQNIIQNYKKNFYKKVIMLFDAFIKDWLYQYGIQHADLTIHDTETQKQQMFDEFGKHGVVLRSGHPVPNENSIRKSVPPLVCWISNVKIDKKPEIFLQLVNDCKDMNVKFILAGSLLDESYLPLIYSTRHNNDNFEYIDSLDVDKSNDILLEASVFVNTTGFVNGIGGESISNTYIQAWLRKVPTVVLHCDPSDVIKRNKVGFHSGTYSNLLQDIRKLIYSDSLRIQLGENARKYAIENFDIEKVVKNHEEEFLKLLTI